MENKEDKIEKWNTLIRQYIAHHKYLKDVGKTWISTGGSSTDVQLKLEEALVHTDKTLYELKLFFAPYLTTDIFLEVRYKKELQQFTEETKQLQLENEQIRQTIEDYKDAMVKAEMAVFENTNLKKRVEWLEEESRTMRPTDENIQSILKRKQEQFDDILKVQNDLIGNLKEQLAQSAKDKEILRTLNKHLEIELQKNRLFKQDTFHADFDGEIFQDNPSRSTTYSDIPKYPI